MGQHKGGAYELWRSKPICAEMEQWSQLRHQWNAESGNKDNTGGAQKTKGSSTPY